MTQEEFNKMLKQAIDEGVLYIMEEQNNYDNPYAKRCESWFENTNYVIAHN